MNYKKWILPTVYLTVFLLFLFCVTTDKLSKERCAIKENIQQKESLLESKTDINSDDFLRSYIINVIIEGSDKLDYGAGKMSAGYVQKNDAGDVAEYVLFLMGKVTSQNKNGRTMYDGNCAGCHGDKGDGLNGAFPKLNKETFEGLRR